MLSREEQGFDRPLQRIVWLFALGGGLILFATQRGNEDPLVRFLGSGGMGLSVGLTAWGIAWVVRRKHPWLGRGSARSGLGICVGLIAAIVLFVVPQSSTPSQLGTSTVSPSGGATPTLSSTPTRTATPTPTFTQTSTPTLTRTPTLIPSCEAGELTIAITELMTVPEVPKGYWSLPVEDNAKYEPWNEYIELYNYGCNPVDMSSFFITDGDGVDALVPWGRMGEAPGGKADSDTMVLGPGKFALVLSPEYVNQENHRPYDGSLREGLVLLTVARGAVAAFPELLGDDLRGLEGHIESSREPDVLVLYRGAENEIVLVVSTYGQPTTPDYIPLVKGRAPPPGTSPRGLLATRLGFPLEVESGGVQRWSSGADDIRASWRCLPRYLMSPGFDFTLDQAEDLGTPVSYSCGA